MISARKHRKGKTKRAK